MSTKDFKQHLKQQAAKDLKSALEELLNGVKESAAIHKDGLHLLGQYNRLQREKIIRIISADQAGLRFRQILDGFLQLADDITDADVIEQPKSTVTYYIDQKTNPIPLNLEALEQEGLRRQAELIIRKLNKLKEALLLATDASVQFKYEQEIAELEKQLREMRS